MKFSNEVRGMKVSSTERRGWEGLKSLERSERARNFFFYTKPYVVRLNWTEISGTLHETV